LIPVIKWPSGAMCTIVRSVTIGSLCVTVSLGTVPSDDALKGIPLEAGEEVGRH